MAPKAEGLLFVGLRSMSSGKSSMESSSLGCSNNCKSVGNEKEQWMEDYHQRFRYVECLGKNGAKTAK